MTPHKSITGQSTEDVLEQINDDFAAGVGMHDYHVHLLVGSREIELNIVSSPGGSEEGGYDFTTLIAALPTHTGFLFAIHPEDFLNKIGKLFGMQDVTTGYPEFDTSVIVKTNNELECKRIFADSDVRKVFENLSGFSFKITTHTDKEGDYLELNIQRAIIDMTPFQQVFRAFWKVLTELDVKEESAEVDISETRTS